MVYAVSAKKNCTRPSKVKIAAKTYTVRYVTGLPLAEDEIGEIDSEKQRISIKDGMPLEREQSVAVHECIHAISDSFGLELTEAQIDGLETGFLALIKDNPAFVLYLKR